MNLNKIFTVPTILLISISTFSKAYAGEAELIEISRKPLYVAQQISLGRDDFKKDELTKRARDQEHVVSIDLSGLNFKLEANATIVDRILPYFKGDEELCNLQTLDLSHTENVKKFVNAVFLIHFLKDFK